MKNFLSVFGAEARLLNFQGPNNPEKLNNEQVEGTEKKNENPESLDQLAAKRTQLLTKAEGDTRGLMGRRDSVRYHVDALKIYAKQKEQKAQNLAKHDAVMNDAQDLVPLGVFAKDQKTQPQELRAETMKSKNPEASSVASRGKEESMNAKAARNESAEQSNTAQIV